MSCRTVTIIVATAIPIIIVAIILFKDHVSENDYSCNDDKVCVRYCCKYNLSCHGEPHDFKGFNMSEDLIQPYKILKSLKCPHETYLGNLSEIKFLKVNSIF
jgi:hypothetical protein